MYPIILFFFGNRELIANTGSSGLGWCEIVISEAEHSVSSMRHICQCKRRSLVLVISSTLLLIKKKIIDERSFIRYNNSTGPRRCLVDKSKGMVTSNVKACITFYIEMRSND